MTSLDLTLRLTLAAGLGAAIGIEREMRRKPAGLRTNILIAVGSALFTTMSISIGSGSAGASASMDRIAAQIVTGIGFVGAGAILRSGGHVQGMTTAATIWVNAAVGMAAGAGEYLMATIATIITLVVLAVLGPVEAYFERRRATLEPSGRSSPGAPRRS